MVVNIPTTINFKIFIIEVRIIFRLQVTYNNNYQRKIKRIKRIKVRNNNRLYNSNNSKYNYKINKINRFHNRIKYNNNIFKFYNKINFRMG